MQRRSERRQFVRVADEVVASVTASGADQPADGRTLNFSLGGVLLASERRLDVGTDVDVALQIDGGDGGTIEFSARVIRCRTLSDRYHELALEFATGSAADQLALQELIARRLSPDPVSPRSA